MPQPDLVIGLDSSTTACKAIVWDRQGQVVSQGRSPHSMQKPRPGWHEQPAEEWWSAAVQALRQAVVEIDPARLAAICIAPQRETFVVTNEAGRPLGSALLWLDERCRDLLPELEQHYPPERFHQETGKPLSANLAAGKLYWLRERDPARFVRVARVLDVHAFLCHRLTGRFVTAWGCADPLGLFDMRSHAWNAALIETLGLRLEQFPEAVLGGSIIGEITPDAARAAGLPPGVPLVAGLGDGQAAGLGACVTRPGDAYLNLGTAVVSGTYSQRYLVDKAFRTMFGGVPGSCILETVLLGGAYTINWLVENFYHPEAASETPPATATSPDTPEAVLEAAAAQVPPGALGLALVPYWNSAMNPYWDPGASGIVVGWRGIHGLPHLYRALLEGIALELRLHADGVERALKQPIERLIAVGGGSRSSLWCQILADVTGKPIVRAETSEATALGAGILAAAGSGLYPDVPSAAQAMARIAPQSFDPDPARQVFYTRLYEEVYRHLFPALQMYLRRLTALVDETSAGP